MGQMGKQVWMGRVGHGSVPVTHWPMMTHWPLSVMGAWPWKSLKVDQINLRQSRSIN